MRQPARPAAGATAILLAVVLVASLIISLGPAGLAAARSAEARGTSSIWMPTWVMDAAVRAVTDNSDLFSTASPFWYDAAGCSTITGRPGAGDPDLVGHLRSRGLAVVPTITGSGLGPRASVACFSDPARRANHILQVVALVRSHGYDGIDLDYENLALTTRPAVARRVRSAFSAFVTDLCGELRTLDKECSITVMPRTSDRLSVWRGKLIPGVYDYRVLGRQASRMRVMAYDQHASGTAAGPIAGFPWVKRIASYVARTAPVARTELGVPTYGRDWTGKVAKSLTRRQAVDLARTHGVRPRFDRKQRELTFGYRAGGVAHRVWFSNPRAVAARHALARRLGFAGAAYWAAGLEQPGTWSAVRRR